MKTKNIIIVLFISLVLIGLAVGLYFYLSNMLKSKSLKLNKLAGYNSERNSRNNIVVGKIIRGSYNNCIDVIPLFNVSGKDLITNSEYSLINKYSPIFYLQLLWLSKNYNIKCKITDVYFEYFNNTITELKPFVLILECLENVPDLPASHIKSGDKIMMVISEISNNVMQTGPSIIYDRSLGRNITLKLNNDYNTLCNNHIIDPNFTVVKLDKVLREKIIAELG